MRKGRKIPKYTFIRNLFGGYPHCIAGRYESIMIQRHLIKILSNK